MGSLRVSVLSFLFNWAETEQRYKSIRIPKQERTFLPQGPHHHPWPSLLRMGCVSHFLASVFDNSYADMFSSRVALNVLWCAKLNRDKRRGKHAQYVGFGDDRDPEFKMVL